MEIVPEAGLRRRAAAAAAERVTAGALIGLGSGSTAGEVIRALADRLRHEPGFTFTGVPTSRASAKLARSLGIPLVDAPGRTRPDLALDGADEIGPGLALIKGGGGALLRERIVATQARRFVVVATRAKVVTVLGRFPLPVEVLPFAAEPVWQTLHEILGVIPRWRMAPDGSRFVTDQGNWLLDCPLGEIHEPSALAHQLRQVPGVLDHGLFLGVAHEAIIAGPDGLQFLPGPGPDVHGAG